MILIKDIEMPKVAGRMEAVITILKDGTVQIAISPADDGIGYWKEYPLISVPPHGRLIDADAFAAEMKKRQDACAEWCDDIKNGGGYGTELYYRADSFLGAMCETKLTLDKMPTIIPAEGVE